MYYLAGVLIVGVFIAIISYIFWTKHGLANTYVEEYGYNLNKGVTSGKFKSQLHPSLQQESTDDKTGLLDMYPKLTQTDEGKITLPIQYTYTWQRRPAVHDIADVDISFTIKTFDSIPIKDIEINILMVSDTGEILSTRMIDHTTLRDYKDDVYSSEDADGDIYRISESCGVDKSVAIVLATVEYKGLVFI